MVVGQNPELHFLKSLIQVASVKGLIIRYYIPAGFAPSRSGTPELRTTKVVGVCRPEWSKMHKWRLKIQNALVAGGDLKGVLGRGNLCAELTRAGADVPVRAMAARGCIRR